jgi:AbrB family looped-hinge helix DNA binding protein
MTIPTSVKVNRRFQIAVPQQARKRLKIQGGGRLLVDVQDGMILLMPLPRRYVEALAGLHQEIWEGVDVQQAVDKERGAWDASPKT